MAEPRAVRVATPPKNTKRHGEGCKLGDLFRLLGESYVLDILHVVLREKKPKRFVDLQRELKMSPNTLTDRLRNLVACGLLTRTVYNEIPPRVEYAATPKASELDTVFASLGKWAEHHTLEPVVATT
jgi:DNA-binding HxlR family transcriptional regulator